MAWVKCGRYYQLSVWVNGRVETRYGGCGELAHALAELHELDRQDRREALRLARQREDEQRALHRGERERGRLIRDLVAVAAESAGFIRYNWGRWRKRRMSKAQTPALPSASPDKGAEIRRIVADCKAGKPGALAKLRSLGKDHPALVIAATSADLGDLARQGLIKTACGDRQELAALGEGISLQFDALTSQLAGDGPSAIRRLVARAAAYNEMEYWLVQMATSAAKQPTPAQISRLNAAHKRFLSGCRTLAQIQRAEQPRPWPIVAVQVNAQAPAIERPAMCGKSN
jgi:hypothetical protein